MNQEFPLLEENKKATANLAKCNFQSKNRKVYIKRIKIFLA